MPALPHNLCPLPPPTPVSRHEVAPHHGHRPPSQKGSDNKVYPGTWGWRSVEHAHHTVAHPLLQVDAVY